MPKRSVIRFGMKGLSLLRRSLSREGGGGLCKAKCRKERGGELTVTGYGKFTLLLCLHPKLIF